jgi:HEAT repeat protein
MMLTLGVVLVAGMTALYVGFGVVHDWRVRAVERRLERARRALSEALLSPLDDAIVKAVPDLLRVPSRHLLTMFQHVAVDLRDETYMRLRRVVAACGSAARIQALGRRRAWRRRVQAAELLPLLPDDAASRFHLLADRHPLVRARAAESLTPADVITHVDRLLELLDDPVPAVRTGAQQALLRGDARIAEPLVTYLWNASGPGAALALEIVTNLPDPRYGAVLAHHAQDADPQRRAMVARGLGAGAALDGQPVLRALLEDPHAEVRAAAARAVASAHLVEFVGAVGRLLSDASWNVRRTAGDALAALGAPGTVTLRAQLFAEDRFARDMARQVLDALAARRHRPAPRTLEELPSLESSLGRGAA